MELAKGCYRLFFSAILLLGLAQAAFPAIQPLREPDGLAVDNLGNLYVANYGANQILAYNPSYQQLTGRTITKNINRPMQIAFDPMGDLWVQNVDAGNGALQSFTEYAPTGKPINTAFTSGVHDSLVGPIFAVDGVGDIWYVIIGTDGKLYLNVINPPAGYHGGTIIDGFYTRQGIYTAIAARGLWVATATPSTVTWQLTGSVLGNSADLGFLGSSESAGAGVQAMTFDNAGNLYVALFDGSSGSYVQFINTAAGAPPVQKLTLNYQPSAIAADHDRNRLYIANPATNQIQVYSTANWSLINTIQ